MRCRHLVPVEFIGTMRPEQKIVVVEAEDHAEPAKLAALEDPSHFPDIRIEGMGVADDQLHPRSLGGGNHGIAFFQRQGQRLLDQHVLAVLHRFDGLLRMKAMGGCDVDRLDRRDRGIVRENPHTRLRRTGVQKPREAAAADPCQRKADARMNRGGADHERAGQAKPAIPRRRGGCASRPSSVLMTLMTGESPKQISEQRAQRTIKEHDVVELYVAPRKAPIGVAAPQRVVPHRDIEAALRRARAGLR